MKMEVITNYLLTDEYQNDILLSTSLVVRVCVRLPIASVMANQTGKCDLQGCSVKKKNAFEK